VGLRFEIKAAGLSDEQAATLEALAGNVHAILEHLATDCGIPEFDVRVVAASDFAGEVRTILRHLDGANDDGGEVFTTERIGGAVTGKCIPLTGDCSDQVIVLDRAACMVDDPNGQAWFVSLLAHELAHAVIGRARHASGALEGVPRVSVNGVDRAKSIARIAAEEYRVDVISSILLGGLGSVADEQGAARPATAHDLLGDCHRDELRQALDTTVHPGWPDTVQRYREHQMPLEELWREISLSTEGVLTLVAHAEAHAALGATRSPLDELARHRGVELYLTPAWQALLQAIGSEAALPTTEATYAYEQRIADAGGQAILAMWHHLGLDVEIDPRSGQFALWVSAPRR